MSDLARALVAAYPDVWAAGMRIVARDEQDVDSDDNVGVVTRADVHGMPEVCWEGFEGGERHRPTLLPTDDPEWGTDALYGVPDLTDDATSGVLLARLRREWCRPGRWVEVEIDGAECASISLCDYTDKGDRRAYNGTLGEAAAAALVALRGGG